MKDFVFLIKKMGSFEYKCHSFNFFCKCHVGFLVNMLYDDLKFITKKEIKAQLESSDMTTIKYERYYIHNIFTTFSQQINKS